MAYPIKASPITLSQIQGYSLLHPYQMWFFRTRSSWQDFNWHDGLRGPSAVAEILVLETQCIFIGAHDCSYHSVAR